MNLSKFKTSLCISCILGASVFAGTRPVLYDIEAIPVEENKILITWSHPKWEKSDNPTGIYIFRDTKPIENLYGMIPVAILSLSNTSYTDEPGDFREYYYAVIVATNKNVDTRYNVNGVYYYDEELDAISADEKDLLLAGINCTTQGKRIQGILHTAENLATMERNRRIVTELEKDYSGGILREKPLPKIEFPSSGEKKKATITSETVEKTQLITGKKKYANKNVSEVYIFPEDRNGKETVPVKNLIKKDFQNAQADLQTFLKKSETKKDLYSRARFYLAECFYFTGNFEQATKEFSFLQDTFPKQCLQWSKASLDMMSID